MVKKVVKLKTKELFQAYLDKNEYEIKNEGYTSQYFVIRKPKVGEGRSTFYIDDLLDGGSSNIKSKDIFFNFLKESLAANNRDVVLYQLIKKIPKEDEFNYEKDFFRIINFLEPHQDLLFEFMARPRFLEKSWKELDNILPVVNKEEHKIGIIEALTQSNTFKSLDTQKEVYKLIQKHINNPSILDKHFDKINKVGDNQSVIDYVDTPSVVILGFTEEKLIGINLNTEIEAKTLVHHIKTISEKIQEEHLNDLKIINIMMGYNKDSKQHTLNIICPHSHVELNKLVFEEVINIICRFSTNSEVYDYKNETKTGIIQKCKAFQLHNELQGEILNHVNESGKKTMKV